MQTPGGKSRGQQSRSRSTARWANALQDETTWSVLPEPWPRRQFARRITTALPAAVGGEQVSARTPSPHTTGSGPGSLRLLHLLAEVEGLHPPARHVETADRPTP